MAVSLVTNPGKYLPAYNPIEWQFSSTNIAECDFRFIADVYINGVFAIRLKTLPDDNGYGTFRIERILQDSLEGSLELNLFGFTNSSKPILDYYIEVRERYNTSNDCTGLTTLSAVLYTSPTNYAWNGAFQYKESLNYTQNTYKLINAASKFLTHLPNNTLISLDSRFAISMIQYQSVPVVLMELNTYDSSNTLIATNTLTSTYQTISTIGDNYLSVGVGPDNINNTNFDGSPIPAQPLIDSSVKYYTIQMKDGSGNLLSELKRFDIDLRCEKYPQYRIWWLNRLGAYDSYTFGLKPSKIMNVTRSTIREFLQTVYAEGQRGESVTTVNAEYLMTFNTNWLTESEGLWLEELFTSPDVYAVDSTPLTGRADITGAVYNAGLADLVIPGITLPVGTTFDYVVDNGTSIGMANIGSGTITSQDSSTGVYSTDVIASINAGAFIVGYINYEIPNVDIIPLIVTDSQWQEKKKYNIKNVQYQLTAKPSFKVNIQSL